MSDSEEEGVDLDALEAEFDEITKGATGGNGLVERTIRGANAEQTDEIVARVGGNTSEALASFSLDLDEKRKRDNQAREREAAALILTQSNMHGTLCSMQGRLVRHIENTEQSKDEEKKDLIQSVTAAVTGAVTDAVTDTVRKELALAESRKAIAGGECEDTLRDLFSASPSEQPSSVGPSGPIGALVDDESTAASTLTAATESRQVARLKKANERLTLERDEAQTTVADQRKQLDLMTNLTKQGKVQRAVPTLATQSASEVRSEQEFVARQQTARNDQTPAPRQERIERIVPTPCTQSKSEVRSEQEFVARHKTARAPHTPAAAPRQERAGRTAVPTTPATAARQAGRVRGTQEFLARYRLARANQTPTASRQERIESADPEPTELSESQVRAQHDFLQRAQLGHRQRAARRAGVGL